MDPNLGTWSCDGVPKNQDQEYFGSGPHTPTVNDGPLCTTCGLPREAMLPAKRPKPGAGLQPILIPAAILAIMLAGRGFWWFFRIPQPIPTTTPGSNPGISSGVPTPTPAAPNPNYAATFAQVTNVPSGLFNYGGSTTFAPLRAPAIATQITQAHAGFRLRYTEPPTGQKPGSGTGINMLINGQLSFAQSSRSLKTTELDEAQKRGFTLEQVAIAIDGIAFYVSPNLHGQVQGLTLEEVRDIFAGKITNWRDLGGPDLVITPFSPNLQAGGTVDFFAEAVLGGASLGTNVQETRDTTDSIRRVAATPGGIGYATTSEVINQQTIRLLALAKSASESAVSPCADSGCTRINQSAFTDGSYPLTRRLFVIIKKDGRLDQQVGEAYTNMLLSDQGQQLVTKTGFISIR